MTLVNHTVSVSFGRGGPLITTEDIKSYQITSDMLTLADAWSFELPMKKSLWKLTALDSEVAVYIDDAQVLSGRVDEREKSEGSITVSGRDRGGRVVDESAPFTTFDGREIQGLAEEILSPWFTDIRLSNAENRRLVGGRGARRHRGAEPAILVGDAIRHKVMPGETIAEVLLSFLEQADLMAWSTGDGRAFIIGKPNQKQAPAWYFFNAEPGSERAGEANCKLVYRESVAERYSEITVCGAGKGDSRNYGPRVTKRKATVTAEEGIFAARKRLIITDQDVRSPAEAKARALREQALLEATGRTVEIEAPGHGQADPRIGWPAIFRFDTVARIEDEEIDEAGDWFITRAEFSGSKDTSSTSLLAVPVGTELRSAA